MESFAVGRKFWRKGIFLEGGVDMEWEGGLEFWGDFERIDLVVLKGKV